VLQAWTKLFVVWLNGTSKVSNLTGAVGCLLIEILIQNRPISHPWFPLLQGTSPSLTFCNR